LDWAARGSRQLFARPEVRAAVPGLLLAMAENHQLRSQLWADFSGPAVALFTAGRPDALDQADLEARAVLAMAAGGWRRSSPTRCGAANEPTHH